MRHDQIWQVRVILYETDNTRKTLDSSGHAVMLQLTNRRALNSVTHLRNTMVSLIGSCPKIRTALSSKSKETPQSAEISNYPREHADASTYYIEKAKWSVTAVLLRWKSSSTECFRIPVQVEPHLQVFIPDSVKFRFFLPRQSQGRTSPGKPLKETKTAEGCMHVPLFLVIFNKQVFLTLMDSEMPILFVYNTPE